MRETDPVPCARSVVPCGGAFEIDSGLCSPGGWCWKNPSEPTDAFYDTWALDDTHVVAVGPPEHVLHWWGGGWHRLPSGTPHALYSVWAASATQAWAVGEAGTIVRWNGVEWTPVHAGGPTLWTVFGTGPQDVWAGGDAGTLLHWDGTHWLDVPSGTTRVVRALWTSGPQDVWVSVFDWEDVEGEVRRWDGQRWSSLPVIPERRAQGLWGFGPGDVWVVGSRGLMAHWTGQCWDFVGSESANFRRVRGISPTQLWVAGPYLWRFDGEELHPQHYPTLSVDAIYSVAVGPTGPLLAVGEWGALVRHREGDDWDVQVPGDSSQLRRFTGVWASTPTDAWATWNDGKLFHWDGTDWSQVWGAPRMGMYAVSGTSASDVWVAGAMNAAILAHFDGTRWSKTLFPEMEGFTDVWALQPNAVWAVAQSGAIRRWNGSTWTQVADTKRALFGVHGSSEDNVWAVGSGGALFQWNGQQWVNRSFSGPVFRAVWVSGPEDVWIADDDRTLWHWDGQRVSRVNGGAEMPVKSFFGQSANDVWAVGEAGSILHWNGQTWTPVSSGTRQELLGISGAQGRMFTVGTGSAILQRDGAP